MPNLDEFQLRAQLVFFLAIIASVLVYFVFGKNITLQSLKKKKKKLKKET